MAEGQTLGPERAVPMLRREAKKSKRDGFGSLEISTVIFSDCYVILFTADIEINY